MNPRNPIDDFFRQRLEGHELDPPMHLWSEIDSRRDGPNRVRLIARRQWPILLLMLFLLGSSLAGILLWPDPAPPLRHFPIPVNESSPASAQLDPIPLPELRPLPPAPKAPVAELEKASPQSGQALASHDPATAPPESSSVTASATMVELPDAATVRPPQAREERFFGAAELPKIVMSPLQSDPQCVRFGQYRRWRIYADMHVGPAANIRQLKAKSPEYASYADARRETEAPRMSFTTGARLSVVSHFGLALRTGVLFTQYNEHFDFTDNSEEKITITNVYGPNGEIIGTDTLVEVGTHRAMATNRYQMLDIPVLLGYEWRKEKWTVAFNGGALLNVLFDARGSFLSPDDLSPVDFSSGESGAHSAYRREIGIGWYAGLGLHYKLQDDLQLLLEPHFRINPQSVTRDSYVLDQRHMSAGLSIGLRKQL